MQTKKRQITKSELWDFRNQLFREFGVHFGSYPSTRVARAFRALPEKQRFVLSRTLAGYSQETIASSMGISQQSVSRTLDRAQARLASSLVELVPN